ncbi:MAG TPA: prohibitin family protein [Rhizomicrobium sp.]|jgi:regulator of protease activity HflC (stomatin/prohibitin superfamily)
MAHVNRLVLGLIVLGALFLLFGLDGTWYTVDQGERAVLLRWGQAVGIEGPGLHFKVPLVEAVVKMSVREQKEEFKTQAYSQDQQPATVQVSVNYRLPEGNVLDVYTRYGVDYPGILIETQLPQRLKEVFGTFSAQSMIQDRTKLGLEVEKSLEHALDGRGIHIVSVQVEDVAFSDVYETAVENRMKSIVLQYQAEAEKQKRITNADAAAYEVKAAADAQAHAIEVQGNAQATAIKARADALKTNPDLVMLTAAEKWDGILPTTMVPGETVPFVRIPK